MMAETVLDTVLKRLGFVLSHRMLHHGNSSSSMYLSTCFALFLQHRKVQTKPLKMTQDFKAFESTLQTNAVTQ